MPRSGPERPPRRRGGYGSGHARGRAARCAHFAADHAEALRCAAYGLRLRGAGAFESGYDLCFRPYERRVELFDASLVTVDGLDRPLDLEIILAGDIIDVCIDGKATLVNRCPEQQATGFSSLPTMARSR